MAEISPLRRRMIEDMTVRNLSPATTQRRFFGNLAALAEPEAPHGLNSFDASIGSSAPSHLSGVPNRCWPIWAATPIALHHPILAERSQNDQCFQGPALVDPGNATLQWFQRASIKRSNLARTAATRRPALSLRL
jgi:hypothetical protein